MQQPPSHCISFLATFCFSFFRFLSLSDPSDDCAIMSSAVRPPLPPILWLAAGAALVAPCNERHCVTNDTGTQQ